MWPMSVYECLLRPATRTGSQQRLERSNRLKLLHLTVLVLYRPIRERGASRKPRAKGSYGLLGREGTTESSLVPFGAQRPKGLWDH